MKKYDFRRAYGEPTGAFHDRLQGALDALAESSTKRKYRLSSALLAAAVAVLLLAGAGLAAGRLGLFHMLDTADPIVPVSGAEEMVATRLGETENELARLTVEEALYDGNAMMALLRIAPQNAEGDALFNDFLQDSPQDVYDVEIVPMELTGTETEFEMDGRTIRAGSDGTRAWLYVDGVETQIPPDEASAIELQLPIYADGGRIYMVDEYERRVTGRRDGRRIIDYWPNLTLDGAEMSESSEFAEAQDDSSVLIWITASGEELEGKDRLQASVSARVSVDGQDSELPDVTFELSQNAQRRRARLVPQNSAGGVQVLDASIVFTPVQGYLTVDYRFDQADETDIWLNPCDASGKRIATGSGNCGQLHGEDDLEYFRQYETMQSFEALPETLLLEVKVIGEDRTLGSITCRVVEE